MNDSAHAESTPAPGSARPASPLSTPPASGGRGTALVFAAYGIWGAFPLYFHALREAGAWEILAHRILWTMLLCLVILTFLRDWSWLRRVLADRRLTLGLIAAAVMIALNWVVYVFAVLTGHTYEAALGYFLNPIVTVALGVFVLGERLRRMQWIAIAVGGVAAAYLIVASGTVPWIATVLALSFALYGLLKKKVGATLDPWHSLFAETAILTLPAGVILLLVSRAGDTTFGDSAHQTTLLALAGVVTAIPLLLFAAAAQRVPLVTIGLIQFITPVLQLLVGVVILHEHVSAQLWVGFGIVWVALALMTTDSVRMARRSRRGAVSTPPLEPGAAS